MRLVAWFLLVTMLILSGCSTAPDTPTPTPTAVPTATIPPTSIPPTSNPVPSASATPQQIREDLVDFVAEDGVKLSGKVFMGEEEKDIGVVLAHMGGGGYGTWSWFARIIAQRGYGALAFNFRVDRTKLDRDVRAAVGFLRDLGYQRIVCMGASMGGTASLKVAVDTDLAGVVAIASPRVTGEGLSVSREDLARLTLPKLFVTTEHDSAGVSVAVVKDIYEIVPEPKAIKIFPGVAHGTSIFNTPQRDEFRDLLIGFLDDLR